MASTPGPRRLSGVRPESARTVRRQLGRRRDRQGVRCQLRRGHGRRGADRQGCHRSDPVHVRWSHAGGKEYRTADEDARDAGMKTARPARRPGTDHQGHARRHGGRHLRSGSLPRRHGHRQNPRYSPPVRRADPAAATCPSAGHRRHSVTPAFSAYDSGTVRRDVAGQPMSEGSDSWPSSRCPTAPSRSTQTCTRPSPPSPARR